MKNWVLGWVIPAVPLMVFPQLSRADGFTCLACHGAMKGKIRTDKGLFIEVHIDEEKFSRSVHGGFACTACHKGFKDNPHEPPAGKVPKSIAELASLISTKAVIDPVAAAACSDCHAATYAKYAVSVHAKNIMEKRQKDGAFCADERRFRRMEAWLAEQGRTPQDAGADELERLWARAKQELG